MQTRFVIAAFFIAATSVHGLRPWPDSSARTVVFADQLPSGLNATQRWFAATKLAGTQKMLRDEIRALRIYNTNFLCVHYQLAVGCGPASFIIGNSWTSDWSFVNSQSNWFLLNASSQRVHQSQWNWDVMNVTYTNGNPNTGFPQYWITQCIARIAAAEGDGVFADSFTQDAYTFGQCNPTHPWFQNVSLCQANWTPALTAFGNAARQAFEANTNGFLFLPNLGGLITSWDTTPYGLGHGGMIECFAMWGEDSFFDPSDWQLQMNRAMALARSNKVVIAQTYTGTANYSNRMFALASYLLVRGPRTYLNLLTTGDVALEYYPEYTIDVGGPLAAMPAGVTNFWHAGWGVYRRDFTNGIVLVNPGDSPVVIASLGATFQRAVSTGGGVVNSSGSHGGSNSYVNVTNLTLGAHSGAVLMRTSDDADGDGMPDWWESAHFTNGTAATAMADPDGDGISNRDEYFADTDPTNSASFLRLTSLDRTTSATNAIVQWSGRTSRTYRVSFAASFGNPVTFLPLAGATNIAGAPLNTATDTAHSASLSGFYRIEARLPP